MRITRYYDAEPLDEDFVAYCNSLDYTLADVQADDDLRYRLFEAWCKREAGLR